MKKSPPVGIQREYLQAVVAQLNILKIENVIKFHLIDSVTLVDG